MKTAAHFKSCTSCRKDWPTRRDFLADPELTLIGYQADFEDLVEGLFLFNHSCRTTIAIRAGEFTDLYDGPVFAKRARGTEKCPGHCLRKSDLNPCPVKCDCAYVRDVIQTVRAWPKKATVS